MNDSFEICKSYGNSENSMGHLHQQQTDNTFHKIKTELDSSQMSNVDSEKYFHRQNKDMFSDCKTMTSSTNVDLFLKKNSRTSFTYQMKKPMIAIRIHDSSNQTDHKLNAVEVTEKINSSKQNVEALNLTMTESSSRSLDPETASNADTRDSSLMRSQAKSKTKLVHFRFDPKTNNIVIEDINQVLLKKEFEQSEPSSQEEYSFSKRKLSSFDNFRRDSYRLSRSRREHCFVSSSADNHINLPQIDITLMEEQVEKLPTNLLSKLPKPVYSDYNNRLRENVRSPKKIPIEANSGNDEDEIDVSDDSDQDIRTGSRRKKLQQFYNRKEYRYMFRMSKQAAEEFISSHQELAKGLYEFYMSFSTLTHNSDESMQSFITRWCESDGRGLERAILLSYITSMQNEKEALNDENEIWSPHITKLNDARHDANVPSLSPDMAYQFGLADASTVSRV